MNAYTLFAILITIASLLLILVIMVQNPKGGGLSSSFGGGGQMLGGVKQTNDFLEKSTWTLAMALVAFILLSNFVIDRGNTSIQDQTELQNTINSAPNLNVNQDNAVIGDENTNSNDEQSE